MYTVIVPAERTGAICKNTLSGNILHRKHIFHAGIWVKYRRVEYAFQLDGPYDERKGLRFNKDNILLDPYARAVTGQRHWGERPEGGKDFVYHARVVENNFDWEKSRFLNHPFEDLVIYEMHVRGFTRDASSGVKAPGTFEGLREKIPYLKDLGINAVELMPVFEFDEMEDTRVVDGERLYNYWGYNTVCFLRPTQVILQWWNTTMRVMS